jgi:hypothetical protein
LGLPAFSVGVPTFFWRDNLQKSGSAFRYNLFIGKKASKKYEFILSGSRRAAIANAK